MDWYILRWHDVIQDDMISSSTIWFGHLRHDMSVDIDTLIRSFLFFCLIYFLFLRILEECHTSCHTNHIIDERIMSPTHKTCHLCARYTIKALKNSYRQCSEHIISSRNPLRTKFLIFWTVRIPACGFLTRLRGQVYRKKSTLPRRTKIRRLTNRAIRGTARWSQLVII